MPGAAPARFCAPGKTPACLMMPPYVLNLNEAVGPEDLRMVDFFNLQPREASFYSVEPPVDGGPAAAGGDRDVSSGRVVAAAVLTP